MAEIDNEKWCIAMINFAKFCRKYNFSFVSPTEAYFIISFAFHSKGKCWGLENNQ